MKHRRRWSDNDHYFGPFTYARDRYHNVALILSSGDGDEYPGCQIRLSAFGHTVILALPQFVLKPWRQKIYPESWDASTVARLGRNYYWDNHERQYGFSYSNDKAGRTGSVGFLQVFYGREENFGNVHQRKGWFTPWNNWRHVRHSIYDLRGNHFATEEKQKRSDAHSWGESYTNWRAIEDSCPSRTFTFLDFDGEMLTATTRIEERQWEFGMGWFKWLSWFRKPIIHRSLDITFSGETGKRKGSWKGGTIGHSIEMKRGELHMDAFIRYCEKHDMTYKGEGIWTPTQVQQ